MFANSFFSSSYGEARSKFLASCEARGLGVESHLNPNAAGVSGEALYTDVARMGRAGAAKLLVLISGTHGVEGYCGSAAQTGLLRSGFGERLPDDTAILFIHAINPFGFSHDRRVNESNVDLNRNFVDFAEPPRPNPDYRELHEWLVSEDWTGGARRSADRSIADWIADRGNEAFQAATSGGQREYADGLFFGGTKPEWSNATFRAIMGRHGGGCRLISYIDFHTGLGPKGWGEIILLGSDRQLDWARSCYGAEVTSPFDGTSSSSPVYGTLGRAAETINPGAECLFIALEFGTVPVMDMLEAVRADNWLYARSCTDTALGRQIKSQIRAAFYCEDDHWKDRVWTRAHDVANAAVANLAIF